MATPLAEMLAKLPPDRQAKVEAGYQELREEVERLPRLRGRPIARKSPSHDRLASNGRPSPRSSARLGLAR